MSKKLEKYVKRELQSGSSREQVKKTLVSAGWNKEEVEETLTKIVDGGSIDSEESDIEEEFEVNLKGSNDKPKLVLLVIVAVIMGLLVLGLFMAFTSFDPRMVF